MEVTKDGDSYRFRAETPDEQSFLVKLQCVIEAQDDPGLRATVVGRRQIQITRLSD